MIYDEGALPNNTEVLPGLIMAGLPHDGCSDGGDDDEIEISVLIYVPLSDVRDPAFGLLQEVKNADFV